MFSANGKTGSHLAGSHIRKRLHENPGAGPSAPVQFALKLKISHQGTTAGGKDQGPLPNGGLPPLVFILQTGCGCRQTGETQVIYDTEAVLFAFVKCTGQLHQEIPERLTC